MGLSSRKHRPAYFVLAIAVGVATVAFGCRGSRAVESGSAQAVNSPQFYTAAVQPIFAANCYRCHGGMNHRGELHLDSREGILRGGKNGVVIVPGHPEQSLLVRLIRHEGPANDPMPMPPKSKLSDTDIATITRWIQAGAAMPPDQPQ